jgi:hypothetical protein
MSRLRLNQRPHHLIPDLLDVNALNLLKSFIHILNFLNITSPYHGHDRCHHSQCLTLSTAPCDLFDVSSSFLSLISLAH